MPQANRTSKSSVKTPGSPTVWLEKIVHVGLYLILLAPLFTWSGSLAPNVTARILGFQVMIEVVAAAALLLVFLKVPGREPKGRALLSPVFVALAGFLAYSLLAAFVGADTSRSFWGFLERQDGLFLLLHFLAWAGILAWFFGGDQADSGASGNLRPGSRNLRSYLTASFLVSLGVALLSMRGFLEKPDGWFGWMAQVFSSTSRPGGVFGNPLALGPYLVFHLFFGFYLSWAILKWRGEGVAGRRTFRFALLGAIVFSEAILLLAILAGQTRGVIFGLIAGLFLCGALAIVGPGASRSLRIAGAGVCLALLLSAFALWQMRDSRLVLQVPVLQRMTHIAPVESITTDERLLSWGSAFKGFRDRPLFGWGYDNIYYPLNKYYDPRHVQTSPFLRDTSDTWFDKSHCYYLDLLVERGITGVILYLILLGAMARSLWRMPDRRLALSLAGALAAYLIANAVAFDSFGSLFEFFLIAACIVGLGDDRPLARLQSLLARDRPGDRKKQRQLPAQPQRRPVLKVSLVLVALAVGVYIHFEMARFDLECFQARVAFSQDPAVGTAQYIDAFQHFSPYSAKEKLNCAYLIVNSVINKRVASQSLNTGMLVMQLTREAIAEHPQDAATYVILNDLFNGLALYVNKEFAGQAEAFGRKALELSPDRQEAISQLGRTYVIRNEAGKAVELNRRMLRRADFPFGHWLLGLSLLQNNQQEEAGQELRKAISMGYQMTEQDMSTLREQFGEKRFAELTAGK